MIFNQRRLEIHLHLSSRLVEFKKVLHKNNLKNGYESLPSTVYRMKGYVPIEGMKNPMLFQYAYGLVQWLPEYIKMDPKLLLLGKI